MSFQNPRTALLLVICFLITPVLWSSDLSKTLGRRESRVYSAPYALDRDVLLKDMKLPQRLFQLDYKKVDQKPTSPGSYFKDKTTFWIYRRAHRVGGKKYKPFLFGLTHDKKGRISGAKSGQDRPVDMDKLWIEPAVLSETLDGRRAKRYPLDINEVSETIWRPLLAAEDARFFKHLGLDPKSLARSAVANVKAGKVVQGGSTITQQLVKNRDMTPKRSFARKASEALRSIKLEAKHDKMEILETYLNTVYLGEVGGLAIHGYGAAAKAYFSKDVKKLKLEESALLAAMIQGPNRLSPKRHPKAALERRNWVLERLRELGWAKDEVIWHAMERPIRIDSSKLESVGNIQLLDWVTDTVRAERPKRLKKKKGVVAETTIDPYLQQRAKDLISSNLGRLKRDYSSFKNATLHAALISVDLDNGDILAYVAGNPDLAGDHFDRVRNAKRQIGSLVKPFIVLEAFAGRGEREPLHAATRISDQRLVLDLPSGKWRPKNHDRKYHGIVDIRRAVVKSYNVPFVRLGGYLGYEAVAERLNYHGLTTPEAENPAFLLGTQELSPYEIAHAWSIFPTSGTRVKPHLIKRLEKPKGRKLEVFKSQSSRFADRADSYIVNDILKEVVSKGTGKNARLRGFKPAGKTGSSSGLRDAWFVGSAGRILTVVWVGKDKGKLGLTGSAAAAPIWKDYMRVAAPSRAWSDAKQPRNVVQARVDRKSGMIIKHKTKGSYEEVFRKDNRPKRDRWWRLPGAKENVIR